MPRLALVVMLVALGGCGSDDGDAPPTVSTPPPPITAPLNGSYDLVISPAESCRLPDTPYVLPVEVTTFATGAGNELRGTLAGGGDTFALDMLYAEPGRLQGSLSTRGEGAPLPSGGSLFLRDSGSGWVSLTAEGRAEVVGGAMVGEVAYYPAGSSGFYCSRTGHSWSLVAR